MQCIPKKTLFQIEGKKAKFIAKVKNNQKGLLCDIKDIEEYSEITEHLKIETKEREKKVIRDIIVYRGVTYPFNGAFIENIIRIDKYSIDEKTNEEKYSTDYYISNFYQSAKKFSEIILNYWRIETMHQYKDVSLKEDSSKSRENAFILSVLRSIVVNILKLHKVSNFNEIIEKCKYSLALALSLIKMTKFELGIIKL